MARTCIAFRGHGCRPVWAGCAVAGHRSRVERWLSAAIFRGARNSGSRHRTHRQHRRSCDRQGHSDPHQILRAIAGRAGASQFSRPDRRQQCLRPCAGHQRLYRRLESGVEAERRHFARVSAFAAAHRAGAVRYHLSRAFLLSVAWDDRTDFRFPRSQGLRRRAVDDPRRVASRLWSARRRRRQGTVAISR